MNACSSGCKLNTAVPFSNVVSAHNTNVGTESHNMQHIALINFV